jgi:sterol desaturase/sphingolipid hydroxylase (fatty acid hydroxylase superfamily)
MGLADFGGLGAVLAAGIARWLSTWGALLRSAVFVMGGVLVVVALCTAIEIVVPAERGQGLRGRLRNLIYLVLFQLAGLAALALWILHGPVLGRHAHAPGPVAIALLVAVNLFTIDFVYYWYHRAQHRFPWLWAIHELHHADAELNATSSFRTYWLEMPVQTAIVLTPSLVLFGDQGPAHAAGVMIGSYGFLIFSHCNFHLCLGRLSSIVCGPQVHRIHHSRLPRHRDRNFAQYFPILDRLFGTYYSPARDEFPPTGAEGLASDAPIAVALVRPFRIWTGRLARRAPAGRSSRSTRESRRPPTGRARGSNRG